MVSVIIPTYNGAHKILNVLRSLEKQIQLPEEVIVVVDGSTDNTVNLLKLESFSFQSFRIIEQPNGGRANVRNRGAREANGQLLLFLDDDMVVPTTWVKEHILHHQKFPFTIVTGQLFDPHEQTTNDFLKFKSWLNDKWNNNKFKELVSFQELDQPYITANNFSLSVDTFNKLGGFDERLKDAEDYDMAVRAKLLKVPIYFSRNIAAWHNDNANCANYVRRLRQYKEAHKTLISLKPELYGNESENNISVSSGTKRAIFKVFCHKWWIDSVDNGFWKWLPYLIRFRLYDAIVTANGSIFPEKVTI